jgi:putative flippase GtrA
MSIGTQRTVREVMSFLAVGATGFVIEAIILTTLTQLAAWSPLHARIPSFLTAVLVTWTLNRRLTFAGRGLARSSLEAILYAAIQGGGALVNVVIYITVLLWVPTLASFPVVALAIGAAGGFVFNYLMSSKWLYARQSAEARE